MADRLPLSHNWSWSTSVAPFAAWLPDVVEGSDDGAGGVVREEPREPADVFHDGLPAVAKIRTSLNRPASRTIRQVHAPKCTSANSMKHGMQMISCQPPQPSGVPPRITTFHTQLSMYQDTFWHPQRWQKSSGWKLGHPESR